MSIYTIAFIVITLLVLIGLALFGFLIMKIDRWIDRKERLGKESIYKGKQKTQKTTSEKSL